MSSSLLPTRSQSRDPVTTVWDDIQRRIGNLPPLEAPAPAPVWEPEEVSDQRLREALGTVSEGRPGCSDDASGDTAAVDEWRARRLQELRGEVGRFGSVAQITNAEFIDEVNKAGDGVGIVVFLFKKGHYHSQYMQVLIEKLAARFKDVKFCQIGHEDCIPDYPDANLPTLFMYRDDNLLRQSIGVAAFGGSAYGIDDVEWEIAEAGLIRTELPRNPHAQRHR